MFRVYEYDRDGVLYVEPISEWTVDISISKHIYMHKINREMLEAVVSGAYNVFDLRDKTLVYPDDIFGVRGTTKIYGLCKY